MKLTKKAQSEIIGLVVIVLIVTLVMLFYVSSVTKNGDKSTKKSIQKQYSHNELATSFVNTFLRTSVCNYDVGDLISDCGTRKKILCTDGGLYTQLTSCEMLNKTLIQIKNDTLDVWQTPYGLTIYFTTDNKWFYGIGNCTRNTTGRSAPAMFPVSYFPYTGEAWVELGLCG